MCQESKMSKNVARKLNSRIVEKKWSIFTMKIHRSAYQHSSTYYDLTIRQPSLYR